MSCTKMLYTIQWYDGHNNSNSMSTRIQKMFYMITFSFWETEAKIHAYAYNFRKQ